MKLNCFITGANGYLGGALADYLLKNKIQVTHLSRKADKPNTQYFNLGEEISEEILKDCDVLVHCAYDFNLISWKEIYRINVQGSKELLRKAKLAGVKKIIFISSISAFENCKSFYGKAKLEIEKYVESIGGISIRPALIYGDHSGGMVGNLRKSVACSKIIPVVCGSAEFYLTHQDDLCNLIQTLIENEIISDKPITAANSEPWKFIDILKKLSKTQNKNPVFISLPWQLVWLGIKFAELLGLKLSFRSDSIISLVNPNPNPDFSFIKKYGLEFRSF